MSLEWREIHPNLMMADITTAISISLAKTKLNDKSCYQEELIIQSGGTSLRHNYLFGEQDLKVDDWEHAQEYARCFAIISLSGLAAVTRDGLALLGPDPLDAL